MPRAKPRPGAAASAPKGRFFHLICKIEGTGETFRLKKISNDMKIKDIKTNAEFTTGIPFNIQRLSYLDQGCVIHSSADDNVEFTFQIIFDTSYK